MTKASVAEAVRTVRPRYLRARRSDKKRILDEFAEALRGLVLKCSIRRYSAVRAARVRPWLETCVNRAREPGSAREAT